MIWKSPITVEQINQRYGDKNHIGSLLDITFTEIGDDYLKATMPVDARTHQPYGLLHGGASVVLAETLGSVASVLCVDPLKYDCVGIEVNANHLKAVRSGFVTGVCAPIRIGATVHVWEIKMYNEQGKMNCLSRLTVMVVPKGKV
ncbi:hotdog fold thioesterase [Solitalea lacus]|uniref:hotdog fold thioesterase n=1 Tax=Solitalea lacus TaxID=2911172 RepID=UPI001EDBC1E7|nr:hotdog fold thioesterase [Solitalea lacus]UKJ08125.1 hotdog fold thioesterase [Solitalea lacus]